MFEINLSNAKNQDIADLTQPLQFNSEKELLEIIDKSFDRFSFNGDGKWQSIGNEDRKKMKLSKKAVQDYYQYRRIALALKELIKTKQEKKMTDKFVYNGKGKMNKNKMVMDAIQFGIERETPKLKPDETIKVVVREDKEVRGVVVDVLRVKKEK